MNQTANELQSAADRAEQDGASDTAVAILRRAAEFAARQFGAPRYAHWTDDANEDA